MSPGSHAQPRPHGRGSAGSPAPSAVGATGLPCLRSWAVWAVGVTVYALAVMQRTTLGAPAWR